MDLADASRMALLVVVVLGLGGRAKAGDKAPEPLSLAGQVVDRETKKPVEGAEVVIERRVLRVDAREVPKWAGSETLRTGADGRFTVQFSAEQQEDSRLKLSIGVTHPDYVRKRSAGAFDFLPFCESIRQGSKPFFELVEMDRGAVYTAAVVKPDGSPAAGVKYEFNLFGRNLANEVLAVDGKGETDARGMIRVRMPRPESLALHLTPDESLAPYQHCWGREPGNGRIRTVGTNLGRVELERGERLTGRALDASGRPVAGVTLEANGRGSNDRRTAVTDAEGRFTFPALRPASYSITASGQMIGTEPDELYEAFPVVGPVTLLPKKVLIRKGLKPEPIELREPPTVRVEGRFVDSKGRPVPGIPARLHGQLAAVGEPFDPSGQVGPSAETYMAMINTTVTADLTTRLDWAGRLLSDAEGRVSFRVPKGLRMAFLATFDRNEGRAIKTRLKEGAETQLDSLTPFASIDEDILGITYRVYDCPTVRITVNEEGATSPTNVALYGIAAAREDQYCQFRDLGGGRFRSVGAFPDEDYVFFAQADGFTQARSRLVRPAEGESIDLTLTLLKENPKAIVGEMAPPVLVRTIDGRPLSLLDFRGKFVLLHFWASYGNADADLAQLKGLRDRFGRDERFVMLGLNADFRAEPCIKAIKGHDLDWPQAMLDTQAGRVMAAFGQARMPFAVLIGPDGRIVAAGLQGEAIDKAVEQALFPK